MDKKIAQNIFNTLSKGIKHSANFRLIKTVKGGKVDRSFAFYYQYNSSLGGFLIESKNNKVWLLIARVKNEWYLSLYPDPPKVTQAEIYKTELRNNKFELYWEYKVTKRDGKNPQRKEIFKSINNGSTRISIPAHPNGVDLDEFLGKVFQLIYCRTHADNLGESLALLKSDDENNKIDPLTGYGTIEHRKEVERKAVDFTKLKLKKEGYECESVENLNCGYDLIARHDKNETLLVEVKGTSLKRMQFFLTPNEYEFQKGNQPGWRLALVTNALEKPRWHLFDKKTFKKEFECEPKVWVAKKKGK
ncbi:MAG: DUF3883 domain-containing protein [Pseudohongiellaceae bacterium]